MGLFSSAKKDKTNENSGGTVATLSDGTTIDVAARIDCLGDSCPRPQLMTKKALASASSNEVIEVVVDNPTSMEALPPMCPKLASTHLETIAVDQGWHVYIRKN